MADPALVEALTQNANLVSIRALCGMAGALVLIMALPPRVENNGIDYHQLLRRLFAGAFLPVFMGPWALAILKTRFEYLLLHEYQELIFFTLGSLSYFLFRWLAVWLDQNKDKPIDELKFKRRWEDRHPDDVPPDDYRGVDRRQR